MEINKRLLKRVKSSVSRYRCFFVALLCSHSKKSTTRAQLLVDINLLAVGDYKHLGWEATQLLAEDFFLISNLAPKTTWFLVSRAIRVARLDLVFCLFDMGWFPAYSCALRFPTVQHVFDLQVDHSDV